MSPLLTRPQTADDAGSHGIAGAKTRSPNPLCAPGIPGRLPNIRNVEIYSTLARVGGINPCR